MSNLCEKLELKFKNIEVKIEKKSNYANTSYHEQINLLEERFDFDKLQAKYETNLNNERERLLKENSRQASIEIDLINASTKNNKTKSFFDDVLTFIEQTKHNYNLISIQRKSHMCFQKLLNKEFKFQMVFNASKLTKYQHILGIDDFFNKNNLYNLYHLDSKFWKAVKNQNLMAAGLFIEAGADVESKNEYHQTALIFASERGLFELVKFLLKNDAYINANNARYKKNEHLKASEFRKLEKLGQSIMNNAKDASLKKSFLSLNDFYGNTPLLSASKQGHFEIVQYLVSQLYISIISTPAENIFGTFLNLKT